MIVKAKYEDVKGTALKVNKDGREYKVFMRVGVNESNIEVAIKELSKSKWVIGFDYEGSVEFLNDIDIKNSTVFIHFKLEDIDLVDEKICGIVGSVRKDVRVVIKTTDSFHDMRIVEHFSGLYKNIRFCGGKLLRLDGCNIGCVGVQDIPKKIAESKIPIVCDGCSCVLRNNLLDELDSAEFFSDLGSSIDSTTKKKGGSKGSKKINSAILRESMSTNNNF